MLLAQSLRYQVLSKKGAHREMRADSSLLPPLQIMHPPGSRKRKDNSVKEGDAQEDKKM